MLDRGAGRNSSLFSCFRAWMSSFRGNSRTFRVADGGVDGFLHVNFRSFRLFNFLDFHFSW